MADFLQIITALREQMHATLSRSDVLRPLAWLVGLIGIALLGAIAWHAQQGTVAFLQYAFGGVVLLYGGSFVYCLIFDRDGLRSERYSLNKMAIEHGFVGDSTLGVIEQKSEGALSTAQKPKTEAGAE